MKPCPFCLSQKLEIVRQVSNKWYFFVRCLNCQAEGPHIDEVKYGRDHAEKAAEQDWDER